MIATGPHHRQRNHYERRDLGTPHKESEHRLIQTRQNQLTLTHVKRQSMGFRNVHPQADDEHVLKKKKKKKNASFVSLRPFHTLEREKPKVQYLFLAPVHLGAPGWKLCDHRLCATPTRMHRSIMKSHNSQTALLEIPHVLAPSRSSCKERHTTNNYCTAQNNHLSLRSANRVSTHKTCWVSMPL